MKKFNDEADDAVDDEFDKKFGEEIQKMKDQINECKLSDEFKLKLQEKLDNEYYKVNEKEKCCKLFLPRKMIAVFACCLILLSGCATFADEIESWVMKIFSNTDRTIEQAIENGNYREINMDYVENNGVSIKVDYLVEEDDTLCIAFNILTEEEYDKIWFEDIQIKDENNEIIYDIENKCDIFGFEMDQKRTSKNEYNLIYKFTYLNDYRYNGKKINFKLRNIKLQEDANIESVECDWNFELEIN